ncbi:MAG: response regulator [Caldimonas sp.]
MRILVVADSDGDARTIVARLGAEFEPGLRTSTALEHAQGDVEAYRPEVIIVGCRSLGATERLALALRARAPSPGGASFFLLALVDSASPPVAARLCRQGIFDDYVQQFPEPADPDRLATSVRVACRVAGPVRSPSPSVARQEHARPVVLLVEDDEFSHQLVASMLDSENLELVFEADGAAALERIRSVASDLILMDVMLPGSDGVEITMQLKAEPDLAGIPVVMLTGEARRETFARSIGAGAADFIVKPFTREALVAKIGKYLRTPA